MSVTLSDVRSNHIEVGERVAYNLSGGVALGTVEKIIDKGATGDYHTIVILIRPDLEWKMIASKKGLSTLKTTWYVRPPFHQQVNGFHELTIDKLVVI